MDLADLYRELIVDHNRSPRNFRKMDCGARTAEGFGISRSCNLSAGNARTSACALSRLPVANTCKVKACAGVRVGADDVGACARRSERTTENDLTIAPRDALVIFAGKAAKACRARASSANTPW